MELRVLQYFLAVAREQSISAAAKYLHLSQPTLSRQLKDLEDELGKQLLIRGNRKITLTDEGIILRKHAEEIIELAQKAEKEITLSSESVSGDVCIGTGETDTVRIVAKAAKLMQENYPNVHYHIYSADSVDVLEKLDKGLIDFGIIFTEPDTSRYEYLDINYNDVWGVLMRKDSPLAEKQSVAPSDLADKPLILSRQVCNANSKIIKWFKRDFGKLNIAATYNLIFNASLMVDEGLGYALGLDKLINTTGKSNLCFRPLNPPLNVSLCIVWKKYKVLSKACEKFLEALEEAMKLK